MQTEPTSIATAAFQIPDSTLAILTKKVEKLARRCVKLGLAPLGLIVHKSAERVGYEVADHSDTPARFRVREDAIQYCKRTHLDPMTIRRIVLPCTWVELRGEMPIVAGYLFLARVEHTQAGNILSAPRTDALGPSHDLTSYRTAEPICQHCQMNRRRKDTFVLRSPEGQMVQIGRNCLADYIRSNDAEVAVAILALTEELERMGSSSDRDDEGSWGGRWIGQCETSVFLACACAEVRRNGFKPASFGSSTKSRAAFLSGPKPSGNDRGTEMVRKDWEDNQPNDADFARAREIIAWAPQWSDASDYAHNVKVSLALPSVNPRHEGILASAPAAFERAQGREVIRRAERAQTADSTHQGTIGDRREWILTVLKKASWDSQWGTTVLHTMTDSAGNCFVWRKSGERDSLEIGKTYRVKGTVKSHDDYKGTKQTNLSRCTAVECLASETADPNVSKAKAPKVRVPKSFLPVPAPTSYARPLEGNVNGWTPEQFESAGLTLDAEYGSADFLARQHHGFPTRAPRYRTGQWVCRGQENVKVLSVTWDVPLGGSGGWRVSTPGCGAYDTSFGYFLPAREGIAYVEYVETQPGSRVYCRAVPTDVGSFNATTTED